MALRGRTRFPMFCATVSLFSIVGSGALACGTSTFSANENQDASTSDSEADSGVDAAPATDSAAVDANDDAAPLGFCQTLTPPPYLCMDFDEGNVLRTYKNGSPGLATRVTTSGGSVFQQSGGLSLPNVLATTIPASGNASNALVSADMVPFVASTHVRLDLDFRIDSIGDIGGTQHETFFSLTLADPDGTAPLATQYSAEFHASFINVPIVGVASNTLTIGPPPAAGMWTHATFDCNLATHTFTATINGKKVSDTSANTTTALTHPTVSVGLAATGAGAPAIDMSYDNVVLTVDTGDGG